MTWINIENGTLTSSYEYYPSTKTILISINDKNQLFYT